MAEHLIGNKNKLKKKKQYESSSISQSRKNNVR